MSAAKILESHVHSACTLYCTTLTAPVNMTNETHRAMTL